MKGRVVGRHVLAWFLLVGTVSCGGSTQVAITSPGPTFTPSCVASTAKDQIDHPTGPARFETLTVHNLVRDYRVFRPATLDSTKPMPVVIFLHGYPFDAAGTADGTHFDGQATAGGFLDIFPDGCAMAWDPLHSSPDVDFISHLIDRLASEYSIDKSRVYLVG